MRDCDPSSLLEDPSLAPVRTFGFRLWHVQHAWTRRLEAALAPLGLTHLQYVLLRAADQLARQGEQPTQTRLADYLVTGRMMVSKVLRTLEAKSLLVRAVHPDDCRANHVVLTEAGRQALSRGLLIAQAAQAAFFDRLGTSRRAQLGEILDDLLAMEGNAMFASAIVTTTTVHEEASQ